MKLSKKIILPIGTLVAITAPIAVVISCSKQTSAEENAKKTDESNIKNVVIQKFITKSNREAFGVDFSKNEEKAWNFWASHQLLKKPAFWTNKVNTLLNSGQIDEKDVVKKEWIDAKNDKPNTKNPDKIKDIQDNFYPSWAIGKEIIKKNPNLLWGLEINKLLLVQRSLTMTENKTLQNMYKGKKEKDIIKNLITLDNWKKVISGKESDKIQDKQLKYFYLIKFLKENTPTFVWKRTFSDAFWGQDYINNLKNNKLYDLDSFNKLGSKKDASLLEKDFVKSSILQTTVMPSLDVEKLYDYKGMTGPGYNKGELDYSETGLKMRIKGTKSEAGFVDKDGNIQQPIDEKNGVTMTVDSKTVTAEFVMQFLPWFDARDKDGKEITDVKKIYSANDDKSIFRLEDELIDKKNSDNMQKLIFTLAMSKGTLFTEAKKWLTIGQEEWIDTNLDVLKKQLQNEGLAK